MIVIFFLLLVDENFVDSCISTLDVPFICAHIRSSLILIRNVMLVVFEWEMIQTLKSLIKTNTVKARTFDSIMRTLIN